MPEERFNRTLDQGLVLVEEAIAKAEQKGVKVFPGSVAFLLHDTYGFPVEVTREIAEERGLTLDLKDFETEMEGQRKRARGTQKGGDALQEVTCASPGYCPSTEFKGLRARRALQVVKT